MRNKQYKCIGEGFFNKLKQLVRSLRFNLLRHPNNENAVFTRRCCKTELAMYVLNFFDGNLKLLILRRNALLPTIRVNE